MSNPRQNKSELGRARDGVYLTELDSSEYTWKGAGSQQKAEKKPPPVIRNTDKKKDQQKRGRVRSSSRQATADSRDKVQSETVWDQSGLNT